MKTMKTQMNMVQNVSFCTEENVAASSRNNNLRYIKRINYIM